MQSIQASTTDSNPPFPVAMALQGRPGEHSVNAAALRSTRIQAPVAAGSGSSDSAVPGEGRASDEWLTPAELLSYDRYLVFFSGGKDSLACLLRLLELGVPADKIELHHHLVDGIDDEFMDWPVTPAYCEAIARHFGTSYSTSWRVGGFRREMLREDSATAPVAIPGLVANEHITFGGDGPRNTRRKFPQVTASLSQRYCSAALKIDVGDRYVTNHPKFREGRTLVVTGERAQESAARSNYKVFEPHRSDNRNGVRVVRFVDQVRLVHTWSEEQVWDIIARHGVQCHPVYHLGIGRCSCRFCIFADPDQLATLRVIAPEAFEVVAQYEAEFGFTIDRKFTVHQRADKGTPHVDPASPWVRAANATTWDLPVITPDWVLPKGAYAHSAGPL